MKTCTTPSDARLIVSLTSTVLGLLLGIAFVLVVAQTTFAQSHSSTAPHLSDADREKAAEFYRDKAISFVTYNPPGGSPDIMLQTLRKYLPRYIPGNPRMGETLHMPGGGGTISANYLWERAPKDGTTIGWIAWTHHRQFEGHKAVRFDVRKINWIAHHLPRNDRIVVTRAGIGLNTIEDLLKAARVNMGTIEIGHTHYVELRLGQYFLNAPFNIIPGYSSPELDLAVERGEIDGRTHGGRAFLSSFEKEYRAGTFRVHWSSEPTRFDLMPNVPTIFELVDKYGKPRLSELEMRVLKFIPTFNRYPRNFAMPPGVPRERVLAIREGFYRTLQDPAFQEEFEKLTRWPVEYVDGETILQEFTELVDAPRQVADLFRVLTGPQPLPKRK